MSEQDQDMMSGVPVDWRKIPADLLPYSPKYPKPGYTKAPCGRCGELLWIGPKQTAMLAEGAMPLVCPECAAGIIKVYDKLKIIDMSEPP